jgi:[acyl-carrier-protein] S-malonyltransferase
MFDLIAENAAACETLVEASAAAGFDVVAATRSSADMFRNAVAQPLICAYQVAAWAALAPLLPGPALFAGYSVGELGAYGCAGALTALDTVRLARERAALMDAASGEPAGLVAVRGLSRRTLGTLCREAGAAVAIVNGEEHCVVGGQASALHELQSRAAALGATVQRLKVAVAAHTALLEPAAARFRALLEASPIAAPRVPVLAGISGAAVVDRDAAIDALAQQISTTVQWSACLDAAWERGCRVFLELGPCNALTCMVRERLPDTAARSLADFRSLPGAAEWVRKNV